MVRGLGVFDVRLFGEMQVLFGGSSSILVKVIPKLRPFSVRQTAWMLIKKPEQLNDEQMRYRDLLLATSEEFQNLRK
jgi:hypothetical protein